MVPGPTFLSPIREEHKTSLALTHTTRVFFYSSNITAVNLRKIPGSILGQSRTLGTMFVAVLILLYYYEYCFMVTGLALSESLVIQ